MSDYMDDAMRQAKEAWLEAQTLDRHYRKMHFNNLVSRAELMEEEGRHMDETAIGIMETASQMKGLTPESRHRMSKEIAEDLLKEKGEFAHFYCAEKLANDTKAPRLWRDVLSYLDEIGVTHEGGMDSSKHGCGSEQANGSDNDS